MDFLFQPAMSVEKREQRDCMICGKKTESGVFCRLHTQIYEKILKNYEPWKKALGTSWKEYLSEIAKNPVTGTWVREVAEYLINHGEEHDVA